MVQGFLPPPKAPRRGHTAYRRVRLRSGRSVASSLMRERAARLSYPSASFLVILLSGRSDDRAASLALPEPVVAPLLRHSRPMGIARAPFSSTRKAPCGSHLRPEISGGKETLRRQPDLQRKRVRSGGVVCPVWHGAERPGDRRSGHEPPEGIRLRGDGL